MRPTRGSGTFTFITKGSLAFLHSLLQIDVVGGEETELALALAEPPTLVHLEVRTDEAHLQSGKSVIHENRVFHLLADLA